MRHTLAIGAIVVFGALTYGGFTLLRMKLPSSDGGALFSRINELP